jgi:photosystem II stability/assembly factor-like uncharacterized protein
MKLNIFLLMLFLPVWGFGQWGAVTPGFGDTIGVKAIDIVNENTVWSAGYRVFIKYNGYGSPETDSAFIGVTKNGGLNWETNHIPIGSLPLITSISALDENNCFIAGYSKPTQSFVLKTEDGGHSFTDAYSPDFGLGNNFVNYIHFFDPNQGVVMADPKNGEFLIFTTVNGGNDWTKVHPDSIPNPIPGEFAYTGESIGNFVWFGTSEGRVYRSLNKGQSWQVFQSPLNFIYNINFSDELHGISSFGYIAQEILPVEMIITNDGGETWSVLDYSAIGDSTAVFGFEYIPNSPYILLTTCKGSITDGYFATWVSPDRGITWQQISTGENIHWPTFISPTIGWGGEGQQFAHKTKMFKYTGSPLVGLFSGKALPQDWSISPNPCVDHFNLDIKFDKTESYLLLINDVQGKLMYSQSFEQDGTTPVPVNFGKLSAGNYVVTLLSKEGKGAKWMVVAE